MTITPGIVSDWVLEVAAYADTEPTSYTQVYGIQNYTPPGVTKNNEDDSDFDSAGWASEITTGLSFEATATVKVPRATMAADPGQEILRAAGKALAEDGKVYFRTYKRGATTGIKGVANAGFTEGGGARTDLTTAEVTLGGASALDDYTIV